VRQGSFNGSGGFGARLRDFHTGAIGENFNRNRGEKIYRARNQKVISFQQALDQLAASTRNTGCGGAKESRLLTVSSALNASPLRLAQHDIVFNIRNRIFNNPNNPGR